MPAILNEDLSAEAQLMREGLISMAHAAEMLPPRKGKRRHASTIYRYITEGVGDLKLEGVKLPDGWATTRQAVERFLEELTRRAREGLREAEAVRKCPAPRTVAAAKAARDLDAAGIGTEPGT
jgi:hypothetical protein